ncbi:hypothetical protein L7F22_009504 [Adiantum nelumboides]|nr:hypothetical protein [Adiantum nelumboides]
MSANGTVTSFCCEPTPEIALSQPFQGEWLWGNFPAYGLLGSCALPDGSQDDELRLCFAASGDLRNVIETVCQIPDAFNDKAIVYVNDHDPKVVLRNFLMLELLRVHQARAFDAVIALWYSVALTSPQRKAVRALARQVRSWSHAGDGTYSYASSFCSSMPVCLVAQLSSNVMATLQLLYNNNISLDAAKELRKSVMMSRPDLGERKMGCLQPAHRVAYHHFGQTGLLLPFGSQVLAAHHDKANQFLFSPALGWTLGDGADPLDGWDSKEIKMTGISYGVPVNDLYGCLFFHVRAKLQLFLHKWRLGRIRLVLTDKNASNMAADLQQRGVKLHRVDTSNLADEHYMGIQKVLMDWAPLLHTPANNLVEPIIITYFLNWALVYTTIKEIRESLLNPTTEKIFAAPAITPEQMKLAYEKAFIWGRMKEGFPELVTRMMTCGNLRWYMYFHDFSNAFDGYLAMCTAVEVAQTLGLQRKQKHFIVPHRLFVATSAASNATLPLDVEDFYERAGLGYDHTLTERFVEWTRG